MNALRICPDATCVTVQACARTASDQSEPERKSVNVKWLAQSTIYRGGVDLVAIQTWGDRQAVARPVEFIMDTKEPHTAIGEPTLTLEVDSARSLLQALWDAGLRPADWSSPDGEINALRKHVDFAEHVAKTLLGTPLRT
jgi:hypothetical protein